MGKILNAIYRKLFSIWRERMNIQSTILYLTCT
jgi:hypothetical protein